MIKPKLEAILASTIPLAESLFYKNSAPSRTAERVIGASDPIINNPNITPYVGNFPEGFAIPAASGFLGDYFLHEGIKRENKLLEKIGEYFPEISTAAISAYFALGETILPQILPGTADVKDLPAVILSALVGYTISKVGRKSGFNEKAYSIVKSINRKN